MAKSTRDQLGIENLLWQTANNLRGNIDSSNYKHVVLGMLFLKYMFDVARDPDSDNSTPSTGDLSWPDILDSLDHEEPAKSLDVLIEQLEDLNPSLRDAFPRFTSFEGLSGGVLKQLATSLNAVDLAAGRELGKDVLSRTYEYFLTGFAQAEGRLGGEFYTPASIVRLMVELLQPFYGSVYDPACGTGGLLVQAKLHAARNPQGQAQIRVYGQESNPMTWRLGRLNLAMHGLDANLGATWGDTFSNDQHRKLKADFILTNPPFGKGTKWPRAELAGDQRWEYGIPPENPANFAWLQHYIARLSESGVAVTVMPNGPLTSRGAEGPIRAAIINADLVECIITLPTQLFYSTPIPVSLWILNKDKQAADNRRSRTGEVLMIDARQFGHLTSKVHRDLAAEDIAQIVEAYHTWQGRDAKEFLPVAGLSESVSISDIAHRGYSLNPSEYVRNEVAIDHTDVVASAQSSAKNALHSLEALSKGQQAASRILSDPDLGLGIGTGEYASSFTPVRLGDIAQVIGGGTPNTKVPEFFGGEVQWITPKDMSGHRDRTIVCGARTLTRSGLESSTAHLVPQGSILVSTRAPIGLVAMAGAELATNQGIRSVVIHDPNHDPRFWYYVLKTSTTKLESAGNGTTFRELRGSTLADMHFPVPSFNVQVEIADYLSKLELTAETARASADNLSQIISSLSPALTQGVLAADQYSRSSSSTSIT